MLTRLRELAAARSDFAFETTLSGRTYLPFLRSLRDGGYEVHMYYFWLEWPDLAIRRVKQRVARGGHHIPPETIRRRFTKSLKYFWNDYRHLCDYWAAYDNCGELPMLTVEAEQGTIQEVDSIRWAYLQELVRHAQA